MVCIADFWPSIWKSLLMSFRSSLAKSLQEHGVMPHCVQAGFVVCSGVGMVFVGGRKSLLRFTLKVTLSALGAFYCWL